MGVFDNVNTATNVAQEKDVIRGQRQEPLPSGIYNLIIKYAYAQKAKSGALGVHALFQVADGDHKDRDFRITEYVTSGDAKGNKTFYEKKQDGGATEQFALPGFSLIDSMAQLVVQKSILACNAEKRTIKLYDYDKKAEVPTEVDMFVELVNKGVCGCVLHRIEDKNVKNTQTGEYEPSGKTYATNVVDKFLNASGRKTLSETQNNIPADFKDKWLEKWKDQVDDQSSEVKSAGLKGAPAASGNNADKAPLFV